MAAVSGDTPFRVQLEGRGGNQMLCLAGRSVDMVLCALGSGGRVHGGLDMKIIKIYWFWYLFTRNCR